MNKADKKKLMDEYKMMQEKEFESSLSFVGGTLCTIKMRY